MPDSNAYNADIRLLKSQSRARQRSTERLFLQLLFKLPTSLVNEYNASCQRKRLQYHFGQSS